jgi:hypothetical protein
MTVAELLHHAEFLVTLAVNVVVVIYVFPMWKQGRQRFFAFFGWSGMLGIFTTVAARFLGSVPMDPSQYYYIWCGIAILGIADLVLYGFGIIELVRHFRKVGGRQEIEAKGAEGPDSSE